MLYVEMLKMMLEVRADMRCLFVFLKGGMKALSTLLLLPLLLLMMPSVVVAQQTYVDDSLEVMEVFKQEAMENQADNEMKDEDKHKILFYMGVTLLILLCATAYLGVSMVVFNQEVFVKHMISAGLTVTLGLAHAVAAIVWFFPF